MAREHSQSPLPRAPKDFHAVVEEHWNAVYRLLHTLTGRTHDTEDLTQETFLRALSRFSQFKVGTNLRAWLLRIATNAYFDGRRKSKRQDIVALDGDPPGPSESPEKRLVVLEDYHLLQIALEELSETCRLVFHLRAAEDLSFREIADMVGTTEETARWHMHQARSKLLKRLQNR